MLKHYNTIIGQSTKFEMFIFSTLTKDYNLKYYLF